MSYENNCRECKIQLAPCDFDGICVDCDEALEEKEGWVHAQLEEIKTLKEENKRLRGLLEDSLKVLKDLGPDRRSCVCYECCGNCGELYSATEMYEKLEAELKENKDATKN